MTTGTETGDAFLDGTTPAYNGDLAVYELIADGEISDLAEIHLP